MAAIDFSGLSVDHGCDYFPASAAGSVTPARRSHDWDLLDPAIAASFGAVAGARVASDAPDPLAADFPAAFDLATLDGSNGFRIGGEDKNDRSGCSVSSAGDVNGDGFDDVIIGAYRADPAGVGAGASYIVFGKSGGFAASLDLAALDGSNGFRLDGVDRGDKSGNSVSSAGDVNGDGFDDVIIGSFFANREGERSAGECQVVFGKAGGFAANLDLATLDGSNGFHLPGFDAGDNLGKSVSSAGDVNGDGFDDVIVGAYGVGAGGASYVVFGKADGFAASFDLASLDGSNGFRLDGIGGFDSVGGSVSSAGDLNDDGFDDIIIGAAGAEPGGVRDAGESYVVFGGAAFGASLALSTLDGTNGFRILGVDESDRSGISVSSAGDVNGDGVDDVVIGADLADPGGVNLAGESYVVFGRAGGFAASIDLATLDGSDGFRVDGIDADDRSGYSVSSAGDVNGDGFDDIVIGARFADPDGVFTAGESYVVFGKAGGFAASISLASLDGSNGFRLDGIGFEDWSGISVSSAGDVNGDGFGDIVVGALFADRNGYDSGESYVIFGRAPNEAVRRVGSAADQDIGGGDFDDTLKGRGGDDLLVGGGGDDRLAGGAGHDTLQGGAGDDRLAISAGGDRLTGGAGLDTFALNDDLADGDQARITDFGTGTDRFAIDAEDFGGGLTPGALDPEAFVVNTTGRAEDADDRFIYNMENGRLFFDADGSGSGEGALLAILREIPLLKSRDFVIIGTDPARAPVPAAPDRVFGEDDEAPWLAFGEAGGKADDSRGLTDIM